MVLVFAFLCSQLVLEHTLACFAIDGGNKMSGQGGVDVVETMSSYAGCREISEFASKTSFPAFLPNLIAASSKVREHECVAQIEHTPLEVGRDTEDRNVPCFGLFVLQDILSPCFYHVENDVGPSSGLNY